MNSIAGHLNLKSQKIKKAKFIKIRNGVDKVIIGKFKLMAELSTPIKSRIKKKIFIKAAALNKVLLPFIKSSYFLPTLKRKSFSSFERLSYPD